MDESRLETCDPTGEIEAALRSVPEPEMGKDLVSLGMIEGIRFSQGTASFRVMLTTPDCPFREKIRRACESAAGGVDGVEKVVVEFGSRSDAKWADHPLFAGAKKPGGIE